MAGLSAPQHMCQESRNPRLAGFCDCGVKLEPKPLDTVRIGRLRNFDFEKQAIRHCAQGICDPEPMIAFAHARSMKPTSGPSCDYVRVGIDWLREAKEEVADFANYAVWWLEDNFEHHDRAQVERALSSALLAFDCLLRVEG